MSIPVIQPRVLFGLKTGIIGNAQYVSDSEVLYPAAGVLIVHNFAQQRQRYIRLVERHKPFNILCISPTKKVVAVAETGDKPAISIYDLANLKRKRQLTPPPDQVWTATEFATIEFSNDGKFLMAVLGDPDWTLFCYHWERGKLDSSTKANNQNTPNAIITQVATNPVDSTIVCLVGLGVFRLITYQENAWRQFGYQKSDNLEVTCVTWLNFDRLLLGTTDGFLLFVEGGDLKAAYNAAEVTVLNLKSKEDDLASISEPSLTDKDVVNESVAIAELISFSRGFAFACGPGTVILFEKETNHKYKKRNVFRIVDEEFMDRPPPEMHTIKSLRVNVMQDALLATTRMSQLYTVRLWGLDLTHAAEIHFKGLGDCLPQGPINGLAMCAWKPIFLTTGEQDRTVRVWNYQTETQDLIKQYPEIINCVSLHPTGLYVLIGFADKLRFMVLSIEDLQTFREFNIRNCCACAFSSNGHLFAAMNGTMIQVYSTISLEVQQSFKGHNHRVTSLCWSLFDRQLISCGLDGAVYQWDVESGRRVAEVITKTVKYLGCSPTGDARTTFAISDDGEVKEMAESAIVRAVTLSDNRLSSILLSRSSLMMFVGGDNGSVYSVKFPLSEPAEYHEYTMHNKTITKMCLSYNDHTLVTVSEDGSVCMWKLVRADGKLVKMDREFRYSTEILVSRDDLKDKIQALRDLAMRLKELEAEHGYRMRQTEASNSVQVKEIHEHYFEALKELRDKNEQLENEHVAEMALVNSELTKLKQAHEKAMQQLEATYNQKLIKEYDKHVELERRFWAMRQDFTEQLESLNSAKDEEIGKLTDNYVVTMREKDVQIEELREEACHQAKEHEEIKQQIEDDTDREIVDLRTSFEQQLTDEKEANTRLRGEAGILKKKFATATKEVDEFKHSVHTLTVEHQKFQTNILSLERDVADLKKEIAERDNTISEKEKRIYELKRKNQELEKYKFVLNYKITELKSQIEPKDREIKEKKDQISDMELELENVQKTNTTLELQINELREKLCAADNEIDRERRANRESDAVLRRMRIDMHNAAGLLQDPKKLKDAVKSLYHTYSQDREIVATRGGDEDVQKEFMRQRRHLENTVAALKKQVEKQAAKKSGGEEKLLQENCVLIEEVNQLRKELKGARRHIGDMESVLGLSGKYMSPKSARVKLQMAVKTREEMQVECQKKIGYCERQIGVLKDEIKRLIAKLPEAEQILHKKQEKEIRLNKMKEISEFQEYIQPNQLQPNQSQTTQLQPNASQTNQLQPNQSQTNQLQPDQLQSDEPEPE